MPEMLVDQKTIYLSSLAMLSAIVSDYFLTLDKKSIQTWLRMNCAQLSGKGHPIRS